MKITCKNCGYQLDIEDKLLIEESLNFSCPSCNKNIQVGEKKPNVHFEDSSEMETQLLHSKTQKDKSINVEEREIDTMLRDNLEEESTHDGLDSEISDPDMISDARGEPREPIVPLGVKQDSIKQKKEAKPQDIVHSKKISFKKPEGDLDHDAFYEKTEASERKVALVPSISFFKKIAEKFSPYKKPFLRMFLVLIFAVALTYPILSIIKYSSKPPVPAQNNVSAGEAIVKAKKYFDFDSLEARNLSSKLLEEELDNSPGDLNLKSVLAISYADLGNSTSEQETLRKSLELATDIIVMDPKEPDAYRALALYYLNDPEMSSRYLNRAYENSKANGEPDTEAIDYFIEANIGLGTGDYDKALEKLNKALTVNEDFLRAYRLMNQIYTLKQDGENQRLIESQIAKLEEKFFTEMPELKPKPAYIETSPTPIQTEMISKEPEKRPQTKKGKVSIWETKFEEGRRLFFESNYLGAEKKFTEAAKTYKRQYPRQTKSGTLSEIYSILGQTYDRLYKTYDALNAYKISVANNPRNAIAHRGLAVIYERTVGDIPRAVREYKEYIKNYPNAPDKEEILERINILQK